MRVLLEKCRHIIDRIKSKASTGNMFMFQPNHLDIDKLKLEFSKRSWHFDINDGRKPSPQRSSNKKHSKSERKRILGIPEEIHDESEIKERAIEIELAAKRAIEKINKNVSFHI
jgi:hypothetical protein